MEVQMSTQVPITQTEKSSSFPSGHPLPRSPAADPAIVNPDPKAAEDSCNSTPQVGPISTDFHNDREEDTRKGYNYPIVTALRENEIGKMAMTLAVSITTGLLGIQHSSSPSSHPIIICVIALALSLGYAATWNGVLIRKFDIIWITNEAVDLIEQAGIVLLLAAFYATLAMLFPVKLVWIPSLGFALSLIPFLLQFFK